MNQDTFNMSIRKFLKHVGVHSQREIESAVERAIASSNLKGTESLPVKMTLTLGGGAELSVTFDDTNPGTNVTITMPPFFGSICKTSSGTFRAWSVI